MPRSLRRATRIKKAMRQLNHKQLIDHDSNKFEQLPDKTAAPSAGHHVELDEFDMPDLCCEDWPLNNLTIPTSDHRIPFDNSELPDHRFESPLSNSLVPSPDHGVKFDFKTPTDNSSQAKPHGFRNQTSAPIEKPKHQRIHGTDVCTLCTDACARDRMLDRTDACKTLCGQLDAASHHLIADRMLTMMAA